MGKQTENLDKVLDDTIQNTELDGDNLIDFPAWSDDSQSDNEDLHDQEETEEVKDNIDEGINKISDLVKNYLTQHFNKRKENNKNRWTFWKDFFPSHQKNSWNNNFWLHSQLHSQPLGGPWSSLREIFTPTPPPPHNWWTEMFSSNSRLDSPASPDSMITVYHKMTVDNKTREGVGLSVIRLPHGPGLWGLPPLPRPPTSTRDIRSYSSHHPPGDGLHVWHHEWRPRPPAPPPDWPPWAGRSTGGQDD